MESGVRVSSNHVSPEHTNRMHNRSSLSVTDHSIEKSVQKEMSVSRNEQMGETDMGKLAVAGPYANSSNYYY